MDQILLAIVMQLNANIPSSQPWICCTLSLLLSLLPCVISLNAFSSERYPGTHRGTHSLGPPRQWNVTSFQRRPVPPVRVTIGRHAEGLRSNGDDKICPSSVIFWQKFCRIRRCYANKFNVRGFRYHQTRPSLVGQQCSQALRTSITLSRLRLVPVEKLLSGPASGSLACTSQRRL